MKIQFTLRFVRIAFITAICWWNAGVLMGQNDWKPLGEAYSVQELSQLLIPADQWQPYPNVQRPAGFSAIPDNIRNAYISAAEKLLDMQWSALPATLFMEYARTGNRASHDRLLIGRREQLATLVLAEVFERKGRFTDQIINGIWTICEESFWGVPTHLFLQRKGGGLPDVEDPVVDLYAAETAQVMAWTYYLLKPELDKVNPLIARRMEYETKRRILEPYLRHKDWGYLGYEWKAHPDDSRRVNNWNPWINSNVLIAALILAKDPQLRLDVVHKTMESIDNFVLPYPADGGCDEGAHYWSGAAGALLDYLELLSNASGGRINVFDRTIVRNMGQYIYKMYISHPYYVNYGDAGAKIKSDPALLFRYGRSIGDSTLLGFAAFEATKQPFGQGMLSIPYGGVGVLNRQLSALFAVSDLGRLSPREPLLRDIWLPDIEVMAARSEAGSTAGFYLEAKGGNNGVSHNHNDVGSYTVYYDGRPVLVDAGMQTYTAQTFSSRRYELWQNQSAYHNLPSVNGIMQQEGSQYTARGVRYDADERKASLELNIAPAYPAKAKVNSWIRTITLNRKRNVTITEKYDLQEYIAPLAEYFMTPLQPDTTLAGRVKLTDTDGNNTYYLRYDPSRFRAGYERIPINDEQMHGVWGDHLYRVTLYAKQQRKKDKFSIVIEKAP